MNKCNFFLIVSSFPFCAAAATAFAAPSPYSAQFGALNLENPTTSTLMRDHQDPNLVWVLPPTSGKAEFKGFRPSANIGFCEGLKSLNVASNALMGDLRSLNERVAEFEPEIKLAEEEYFSAKQREAAATVLPATAQFITLSAEIERVDARIEAVSRDLDTCNSEQQCSLMATELRNLIDHNSALRTELREFRSANRSAVAQYEVAKAEAAAAEEKLSTIQKRVSRYAEEIKSINSTVRELYKQNGILEAGQAFVDYDTGWSRNVQTLESQFSQYQFSQVPTRNVRLFASLAGGSDGSADSYYSNLPAILDYSMNGVRFAPWGESVADSSALPNLIAGDFRLSLIGGCPLVDKAFFDDFELKPEKNLNGDPLYSISVNYEYPATFTRKMTASYNLYQLYEVMKETGSSGGFFSSRDYARVVENIPDDRASFSISFSSDDGKPLSQEEKDQIRKSVKEELVARVLQQLGTPNRGAPRPVAPLENGVPPARGAVVLANGLSQSCGWSMYCLAGSWLLRTADSIWGSSKAESSFKSTWNRTATETWSDSEVRYVPAATAFSR